MKKIVPAMMVLMLQVSAAYAQKQSCCSLNTPSSNASASATSQFAALAADDSFVASHEEPKPYAHQTQDGTQISFSTPDGKTASAFAYMDKEESNKYLLVIHEWWGLNEYVKKEAEKYYQDLGNVNVIALDLYDGKVAGSQEEARQYMQGVEEARAQAIIKGAIQLAGPGAEIATLGWCFGGGWALQAAIIAGEQAKASVMYYGMPEQDVSRLAALEAPVLGIFASKDGWITPEVVETFKQHMEKMDKELTIEMYDAAHGFANPSNPDHKREAAQDAYQKSLRFLQQHLQ